MKKIGSYAAVAAASAALTLLIFRGPGAEPPSKLETLGNLLEERFIGESDRTVMEDAAADAMVRSLGDRWSYYIPAAQYDAYREQMENAYVGIGITVSPREDGMGFDILQVAENGPAREAGLQPGDVLVAVEGESMEGMTTGDASRRIRGEEGTAVSVTVRRDGETLDISVQRRRIQAVVAEGELLTDNIGLVTIHNFDARCAEETLAVIQSLLDQKAEALIFDVRNNPGGYKDELVRILDYLLPEGPLFRSVDYRGLEEVDNSDEACLDLPMAVLVNGESYSAAEFFAAALSEYEAAAVVGEKTCGKGYFQNTFRLPDGSAVGLSVGKYFTPNGVSLADVGITPDVTVPVDEETAVKILSGALSPMEDPQILAAITAVKSGK